jgi:plasmid stability protein
MVDILVRNLDKKVADGLKKKAAASGRSVAETARAAIEAYVTPDKADKLAEMRRVRGMSPRSRMDSTAMIREDRDNDEHYR